MNNKIKRLYVIGNGFDLCHARKTSYNHFKKFLVKQGYIDFLNSFEHNRDEDLETMWNEMEMSMGIIDTDRVLSSFMLDYCDVNWRDSSHHDTQYELELSTNFINTLPNYLKSWIQEVESMPLPKAKKNSFTSKDKFLTFNYTNTLEDVYHINSSQVIHVHGSYKNGDNLIMGQTTMNTSEIVLHEDDDIRIIESKKILDEYYNQSFKPINDIISANNVFWDELNTVNEVFLLGNYISQYDWVDSLYYYHLYNCLAPDCLWHVSYYGDTMEEEEEDKKRKRDGLLLIGIDFRNINFDTIDNLIQQ